MISCYHSYFSVDWAADTGRYPSKALDHKSDLGRMQKLHYILLNFSINLLNKLLESKWFKFWFKTLNQQHFLPTDRLYWPITNQYYFAYLSDCETKAEMPRSNLSFHAMEIKHTYVQNSRFLCPICGTFSTGSHLSPVTWHESRSSSAMFLWYDNKLYFFVTHQPSNKQSELDHRMTQDEGGEKNLIWQVFFLYLLQGIPVFSSERRNWHVFLTRRGMSVLYKIQMIILILLR